jgi:O-antigen/teichoic acid export membrane protein
VRGCKKEVVAVHDDLRCIVAPSVKNIDMSAKKMSVRKSLVFSFAQKYTTFVFSFAAIMIVSRLLTPEEIGVFSVATGLTILANTLRTFGVSDFLVQEERLTETMIRTSFTINLIIAWTLAVVLFGSSWELATFFNDVGVGRVVRVVSVSFFLVPFGITAMALLTRELAFGALYKINTSSSITSSLVTVVLAYAGFGYMSMAWASLASMIVMVLACALWGYEYRVRGMSVAGWRHILPFGAKMTASNIVKQVGEQSANVVIGKMLGMADVGFYSRGYGPINMFRDKVVDAIGGVAFPAFAAEHRNSGTAPQLFMRALVYLTGISWPFFAFAALAAPQMIRILFGNQWDAAVPLMRWLCAAAIIGTLTYQCNPFFVAIGRVGAATTIEVQYQLSRLAIAVAAAFYSVEAVAASQVLVYMIAAALYYRKMHAFPQLAIGNCVRALFPSVVVTLTACIVPAVIAFMPGLFAPHLFVKFAVSSIGAGAGWIIGALLVRHPLLAEVVKAISLLGGYLARWRKV